MKHLILVILASILIIPTAFAYQPRLAPQGDGTETSPFIIENPAMSQIFYGQLQGSPVYYKFLSEKPFPLNLQILAPYSPGYDANAHKISVYVSTESRKEVAFVYEDNYFWSTLYDDLGNNYYFAGPAIQRNLTNDTYIIRLFNSENTGRYALAIGSEKSYEFGDMFDAYFSVLAVKQQIFSKRLAEIYSELVGLLVLASGFFAMIIASRLSRKKEYNKIIMEAYYPVRCIIWIGLLVLAAGWYINYVQNPYYILGVPKALLLALLIINWTFFFITSYGRFKKLKLYRASATVKFQNTVFFSSLLSLVIVLLYMLALVIVI